MIITILLVLLSYVIVALRLRQFPAGHFNCGESEYPSESASQKKVRHIQEDQLARTFIFLFSPIYAMLLVIWTFAQAVADFINYLTVKK